MNTIYQWFQVNLDVIFFVYGLTFIILGLAILLQPKKESKFKLANILWLLVLYCLIHSPSDFINMWLIVKGTNETIYLFGQILTYLSYIFLFEFGRRLLGLANKKVNWWILPIIYFIIFPISLLSNDFWVTIDILIGYFVRFPAGIMAGVGFIFFYYSKKEKLIIPKEKKYFYSVGVSLLAWSFFCGIIRLEGNFFPANILNIESFFSTVNIPVYVFRSICALIITWSLISILKIFNWEAKEKLKESEKNYRHAFNRMGFYKDLIAHDINNVLQTLLLRTDLCSRIMMKPETQGKAQEMLHKIKTQVKKGAKLVLNVQKLSSIGETAFSLESTEILEVLKTVITNLIEGFPEKKINIQVNSPSNQLFIKANKLLTDMFENILLNAVRHNENSPIEILLRISRTQKNGKNYVKMEFMDNGVGVADDRKDLIFKRGFNDKKSVYGMGLGLSLVKKIVTSYNGQIWLENRVKKDYSKGSNFIIELPAVE